MKMKFFSILSLICLLGMTNIFAQAPRKAFVDGKVWVKIKSQTHLTFPDISQADELDKLDALPAVKALAKEYGLYKLHRAFQLDAPELNDIYTFWIKDHINADVFVREMAQINFVEYAEQAPMFYADLIPNDYNAAQQWYLPMIKAPEAWDISQGDTNITVAIVDDAVTTTHEDLLKNLKKNWAEVNGITGVDDDNNGYIDDKKGWDAADNDNDPDPVMSSVDCFSAAFLFCHGSAVASSACAVSNNGKGTPSIGYNCRYIPIKCQSNSNTVGGIDAGYEGVSYAIAAKANVINMSWGGTSFSTTGQTLMNTAHNRGIVLVSSAGNDNVTVNHYPSDYRYVISNAASDATDGKAGFSNYNDSVDVISPGQGIRAVRGDATNAYQFIDGTSFSAPITAGLCALMLSANPCLTPAEVEYYLETTADSISDMGLPQYNNKLGAGRINAKEAMLAIAPTAAPVANFTFVSSGCGGMVDFSFASSGIGGCPKNYFWTFQGGTPASSTLPNPTVSFPSSGTYSVMLIVNNSLGTNSTTQNITITANPLPTVTTGPDVSGCFGDQLQVTANCIAPGATFLWSPNIGISSTSAQTPTFSLTSTRTYYVTATDANGCKDVDTIKIIVNPKPSIFAGSDVTSTAGAQVQLNALCSSCQTFSWSPNLEISSTTVNNPIASPTVTRYYACFGTNQFGCVKYDDVLITIPGTVDIDKGLNGNHIAIKSAYPNPASTEVNFNADLAVQGSLKLTLFDVAGKEISVLYQGQVGVGAFHHTYTRSVPAGIYLAVWEYNGERLVQRVSFE